MLRLLLTEESHINIQYISGAVDFACFFRKYKDYLLNVTEEVEQFFEERVGRKKVKNLVNGGYFIGFLLDLRPAMFASLNSIGSAIDSPL